MKSANTVKIFRSQEEYEAWIDGFENCSDYSAIPVAIDDGWKVSADMFTECKSWKTALRRFAKTFAKSEALVDWFEGIRESCENGCFKDTTGWRCSWTHDEHENRRLNEEMARTKGSYSWGVEEVSEGCWYIFLNVSGMYAGRPARA